MPNESRFVHMVFFYLKPDAQPGDADALMAGCREHLPKVPGILRLDVGKPAGTPRDVVDNSYGVALVVEFADSAGHDVYEHHPDHLKFIDACKQYWSRVQVYDAITS